jgi:hypothetical protein
MCATVTKVIRAKGVKNFIDANGSTVKLVAATFLVVSVFLAICRSLPYFIARTAGRRAGSIQAFPWSSRPPVIAHFILLVSIKAE